jgi:hypothetical protein
MVSGLLGETGSELIGAPRIPYVPGKDRAQGER